MHSCAVVFLMRMQFSGVNGVNPVIGELLVPLLEGLRGHLLVGFGRTLGNGISL